MNQGREHIHGAEPFQRRGVEGAAARFGMILTHGRGATASSILTLADELPKEGMAYLAPQASGQTWYPHSFLAPREANEPGLSSALRRLDEAYEELVEVGIESSRIVLVGFSQGACLALDYAARRGHRLAGVAAFSGGLIGPRGMDWRDLESKTVASPEPALGAMPVFLGCSDRDPHIPLERVQASAALFERLGADVEMRIYPGMPHTIIEDEMSWVRALLDGLS